MKKEVFNKTALRLLREALAPVLFSLAIILMAASGLEQARLSSEAENMRILRDGIQRAAIKCYATEGYYPESLQYLEEHYGVVVDHGRYMVHYMIFASNIQPDITIIAREARMGQ